MRTLLLACVVAVATVGCRGDVRDYCLKLEECERLPEGETVDSCEADWTSRSAAAGCEEVRAKTTELAGCLAGVACEQLGATLRDSDCAAEAIAVEDALAAAPDCR